MLDIHAIRLQFPALQESYNGRLGVFFDNPGGTQVHESVIAAVTDYYTRRNSNTHGVFETSIRSDAVIDNARQAAADLLGADHGDRLWQQYDQPDLRPQPCTGRRVRTGG